MDRARIIEEFKKISWQTSNPEKALILGSTAFDLAERIAAIARAEALEQAAKICDQSNELVFIGAVNHCAKEIRALKEAK